VNSQTQIDVEGVPEQGKAEQAALHRSADALDGDLRHHYASQTSPAATCSP